MLGIVDDTWLKDSIEHQLNECTANVKNILIKINKLVPYGSYVKWAIVFLLLYYVRIK